MKLNLDLFNYEAQRFLDSLSLQLEKFSIVLKSHWMIDHLCYRVSTDSEYTKVKEEFLNLGNLLIESEVNGRLISTFKLFQPIKYKNWQIPLIELPAPKKGKQTQTGFEHLEVVCDVPFSVLKSELKHCECDLSGLEKPFNQEFEIKLEGCAIKFHHLSLESVVRLEKNRKVYEALVDSQLLKILNQYSPLVAGTFPLGLSVYDSDLDILLECSELDSFEKMIKEQFGNFLNFKSSFETVEGNNTLIVNFIHKGVPFELFAQYTPSVNQRAYQHFLIEERLLSIGGDKFHRLLLSQREKGLKTELAFSETLGLKGNAYESLLEIYNLSDKELIKLISVAVDGK